MPLGGSGGESTSGEDDTSQREEEELVAARESEQPEVEQRTCAGVGGERWNNRSVKDGGGFSVSWHLQGRMPFWKAVKYESKSKKDMSY